MLAETRKGITIKKKNGGKRRETIGTTSPASPAGMTTRIAAKDIVRGGGLGFSGALIDGGESGR